MGYGEAFLKSRAYNPSGSPHYNPLRALDMWVPWKAFAKPDKIDESFEKRAVDPVTFVPKGFKLSDKSNRFPYGVVRDVAMRRTRERSLQEIYGASVVPGDGIGMVFLDGDKIWSTNGIEKKPHLLEAFLRLETLTEFSPSMTGLRAIGYGAGEFSGRYFLPDHDGDPDHLIEAYSVGNQHVSITERPYPGRDVPIVNIQGSPPRPRG